MAEWLVAIVALALVASAAAASQSWLDRHFLPSFLMPRQTYVRIETSVRLLLAASGIALMLGARRVASLLTPRAIAIVAAIALALGVSELVLRNVRLRPAAWRTVDEEPRRQTDARLGWTFVPARTGYSTNGGRTTEYTFDAGGYRVSRADRRVDPERPSILFAGESVMLGDGLTYDESVPAQVEALLGTQCVNMAVYGYSTDQMYLKLQRELPQFRQPRAVVALYMTALFGRNLDDDRPHLGPGLEWQPAAQHGRLSTLARLIVPFRRDRTVEHGIAVTREVLEAIVRLARSRGATPLVVVPQIGPEDAQERRLRQQVLDESGVPYVLVEIDPSWHVPWDRHPDARAAHTIALAIAERLQDRSNVTGRESLGPSGARRSTAR
jgi:YD repeat-containing protein